MELINTVVQYLAIAAPYLKQVGAIAGGEATKEVSKQAIRKIGQGAWFTANSIWQKVRGSNPKMEAALNSSLDRISEEPYDISGQAILRDTLEKILKDSPSLFDQLTELLREAKTTTIDGSQNVVFDGPASDNVVVTGDGVIIGDNNISLVNKRS